MVRRDPERRIEIYRQHLRSCLEDMLNRVDAIMDYCYSDNVSKIDITISLNPDKEIPTVEYRALTFCTKGYGSPKKSPEKG